MGVEQQTGHDQQGLTEEVDVKIVLARQVGIFSLYQQYRCYRSHIGSVRVGF